jgi:MraZ protein
MNSFLGSHQNRLDAKGRVSIPASFRALLKSESGNAMVILRPSHKFACIDGWPEAVFKDAQERVEQMALFSPERESMEAVLYADAYPTESDREGRIVLSATLASHANLTDSVLFMGLGRTFQIWEPAAGEKYRLALREQARATGTTLPALTR